MASRLCVIAAFLVSSAVQAAATPLQPTGKWTVDYAPSYCILSRHGTGKEPGIAFRTRPFADEHELLFGTRREALYFASLLLAVKSAVGLGGLLAGFALDFIRFPRDVASITGPLPQDVVDTLGLIQGPVAAAIGVVAALLLLGYKIDRTALMRIQSALAAKTAASSP